MNLYIENINSNFNLNKKLKHIKNFKRVHILQRDDIFRKNIWLGLDPGQNTIFN